MGPGIIGLMLGLMALVLGLMAAATAQDIADCAWDPQIAELTCNLKSLQTGPAVIPQVENSKSLRMHCSASSLYESLVRPDQFGSLPNLARLSLTECKIRSLPDGAFVGLRNLKELSIQGHNSAWSGSMTLQLQPSTFKNLRSLETLDLGDNNIWGLPVGGLCHTPTLTTLNLTRNNIVEVSEVGLQESSGHKCQLLHLRTLDLSYNKISSFLASELDLSPGIAELNLRGNRISVLGDGALAGLWSLTSLDLASNLLTAIPLDFFKDSTHLQKLYLENNTLSALAPDTFSGLNDLLLLNMSRNALTSHNLNEAIFASLTKMVALDLSHNGLDTLHPGLFDNQLSLQILNLQNNAISSIVSSAFRSLVNLHILLLSWNRLDDLPPACLDTLTSLSSLSLDHNTIASLPPRLFAYTPDLQDLALNHNQLGGVPAGVNRLDRLRTLDLGENSILSLPRGLFANLTSLYGLRLAGNGLTEIPGDIFANNSNLHVLNLAHNNLEVIEQGAFKNLDNLRALRLDNNRLKDINGLVASQKNLRWLNVSTNSLQWFDFAFIPKSLEWLDIHNNKVDRIGNYYSLTSGFNLETLDASFNQISELETSTLLHSLRSVYLNNNNIKDIQDNSFKALGNLTRVELQGNELTSLSKAALSINYQDEVPEFLVGGNPWQCDCDLEWLKGVNHLAAEGTHPRVLDLDTILCSRLGGVQHTAAAANASLVPLLHMRSEVPLLHMRSEEFLCQYDAHCIPQCFCCDFFACDCRMQCPEGCACYHDNSWTHNLIQCSGRGHADVPPLIPMDATAVFLDGNNMTELVNPGFIGRRRVREVYLNSSSIRRVTNYSFEGLTEVRVLHLEDNHIEELVGNEFSSGLDHLSELYLQNNFITSIGEKTFGHLKALSVLRLDGNLLTSFPVWELVNNPLLVGLYLARNMWACDCNYVRPFVAWQAKLGSKLIDADHLRCVADHFRGEALATMTNIVCGDETLTPDFQSGSAPGPLDYTPILVSVLLAVLIIVIGYLVAFTFRKTIKDWMFRTSSAAADKNATTIYAKDKLFDVFISYALDDAEFVEGNFAPSLEHGATSYRLCLHQRDFPPTTPLSDTVSVAVESSTRAIVVLSRAYLANQWNHIRAAFMEAIKANNTKVVFIQLEEVDMSGAGAVSDLRHLFEDSPVVRWLDPGFWNKLRYFLPEPVYLTFHRNVTMRGTLQTSNLYQPVLGGGHPTTDPTCIVAAPQKPEQPYQPSQSEHTYHSIDNNHIYHTLDPGSNPNLFLQFQGLPAATASLGDGGLGLPPNRVFINQNLDLSAVAQPQVQTMHRAVHHVLPPEHGGARHSSSGNAAMTTAGRPVPVHNPPPHRPPTTVSHGRSQSASQSAALNQSSGQSGAHNLSANQSGVNNLSANQSAAHNQSINHGRSHSINHAHTNSTSSAKKLLSGEEGEYIV